MTFEEALRTLGIDATHELDSARRAYLRLLKEHSPERDPRGFQRVREAYEVVKQLSFRLGPAASPGGPPAGLHGDPPADYAPWLASTDEPDSDDEGESEPDGSWWSGRHDPCSPSRELIGRGQIAEAAEAGLQALSRAGQEHSLGEHAYSFTELALSLLASGQLDAARAYMDVYVAVDFQTASVVGVRVALLAELWKLRTSLPAELMAAVADSLRAARPEDADLAFEGFTRTHPLRALWLRRRVRREAPMLFQLFGPQLPAPWRPSPRTVRFAGYVILYTAMAGAVAFLRFGSIPAEPDASAYTMVHMKPYRSAGLLTISSCTPMSDPLCQATLTLAGADPLDCDVLAELSQQLRQLTEAALRASRVTRMETDAIRELARQKLRRCGGLAPSTP